MIYINQSYSGSDAVVLSVEGDLDYDSLPILIDTYRKNLATSKVITINLEKVSAVDRSGRAFLKEIQHNVTFLGMPASIQMEIGSEGV